MLNQWSTWSSILCMVTIFNISPLMVAAMVAFYCGSVGSRVLGVPGALIGAILGLGVGAAVGELPGKIMEFLTIRTSIRPRSTVELIEEFRSKDSFFPRLLLQELKYRGHDVDQELGVLYQMLVSPSMEQRIYGWVALEWVFPHLARELQHYIPMNDVDRCRDNAEFIRVLIEPGDPC